METRAAPAPGVFLAFRGGTTVDSDGRPARLEKRPGAPIFDDPGAPNDREQKREGWCAPIAASGTSWRPDVLEGGPERAKLANGSDFASTMFSRCSGVPQSLSEGAVSGSDKLRKTVAPPGGTKRGAIQYTGSSQPFEPRPQFELSELTKK